MSAKLKNLLHLHLIVFIWGFTAVLGKLISIDALPLVWYRMSIASILILLFIIVKGYSLKVPKNTLLVLIAAGTALAFHWITFFLAIKVSNVSIALATMSTGAFFTALLEPLVYKIKFILYELVFGAIVIFGLILIFNVETKYALGMGIAVISAFLGVIFTLINAKLVETQKPTIISFYELFVGAIILTFLLIFNGDFNASLFELSKSDMIYIFILASICTAYAFVGGVQVMKYISPFTVILTVNLEPIYGIILAYFILGESEKMSPMFYLGALIILITVAANGILKNRDRLKN